MKLLTLLSFYLLLSFTTNAQNLSWFYGDWTGETYFPNGPVTKRIIVKLRVTKITGNHFEAVIDNLYPNDTTVRLERKIVGQFINKKMKIESSEQIYIRDPRTQNLWYDCTGCETQSNFSINSDKIDIKIKTNNCSSECDGETTFSRDTSNLNKTQQEDLAEWLHLSTPDPAVRKGVARIKDSFGTASIRSASTVKSNTLQKQKIAAKDTLLTSKRNETINHNTASIITSKSLDIFDSSLSRKPSGSTSDLSQKKGNKDSISIPVIKLAITKNDTTPAALTTRTTNLITTYQVTSPHIIIQLFDNAEIDGDIVTVYHNGQLIANRQSLTHKAVTIIVDATKTDAHHEFIMVADNLGLIAPNTALMRITAGNQKYELEVSSDFDNNSKIAIDYKGD